MKGSQMAESIFYKGTVKSIGKSFVKQKLQHPLLLSHCELSMKQGEFFKNVFIRDISTVTHCGENVICNLSNGKRFKFSSPEAEEWSKRIQWCMKCLQMEWVIEQLASLDLTLADGSLLSNNTIFAFKEVNGLIWSVNSQLTLMEWALSCDQTGLLKENKWLLKQQRRITISEKLKEFYPNFPRYLTSSVSSLYPDRMELYCVTTNCIAIVSTGAKCEDVVFEELFSNRIFPLTKMHYSAMTHIVRAHTKVIWVAERNGRIYFWDLKNYKCVGQLDLITALPEGHFVTSMAEISNEVWCGTNMGCVFRVSLISKRILEHTIQLNAHTMDVTGFVFDENGRVYSVSYDCTVALWIPKGKSLQ